MVQDDILVQEYIGDRAAMFVFPEVLNHGCVVKGQLRSQLFRALTEGLLLLVAMDSVEPNLLGFTVMHERDCVPIANADNETGEVFVSLAL